jgi:prepilin-type N-terminal cleavage/methylation domain-containing protein
MATTPQHRPAPRARARRGFTLLEMMVAFSAGAIALVAIYYIGAASSRHFQEQQRISMAQSSLRIGFEQLRRDISRAGYLGAAWSVRVQQCVNPTVNVQAVQLQDRADSAELPNAGLNNVQADRLTLTGNYVTADEYLMVGINAAGNQARLQPAWQSFRRSFLFQDLSFNDQGFLATFAPGRVLRIRTQQGNNFFVNITGRSGGSGLNPTITFTPAMPIGGSCTQGLADGASVAPISRHEYRVMDFASTATGAQLLGRNIVAGTRGPHLVRQEITFAGAPIAGTERVLFDYVADFDVDMFVDTRAIGANVPVIVLRDDAAAAAVSTARPDSIRSLVVRVATRTSGEDPRVDPSIGYDINIAAVGAARMRRITSEIALPNVVN